MLRAQGELKFPKGKICEFKERMGAEEGVDCALEAAFG
jgi:hypothetical protein